MPILYASFPLAHDAEKAAGALIDQGAPAENISFLADSSYESGRTAMRDEHQAKSEISTTTGSDALMGAAKGLSVGMGLGVVGALAVLAIPGVGLVIGAGAIAAAFGGAAATAVAGAAVGGVMGFLKDQGLSEQQVAHYSQAVSNGGAILSLTLPVGSLREDQAEGILLKYGATDVSSTNPQSTLGETPDPYADFPTTTAAIAPPSVQPAFPISDIEPTIVDPVTGRTLEGFAVDPATGRKRLVRIEQGKIIYLS